jgi:hypothetical protein
MAFGQVFKKRGGGSGNEGESTFETSEEKTEVPEIDNVMAQIDRSIDRSRGIIIVQEEDRVMRRGGCGC